MSVNFEELLDVPADQVEAPQALPMGMYVVSPIKFELRTVNTKDGEKGILSFQLRVTEAAEGVMPEDLVERNITLPKQVKHDFWLSQDDRYRIKKFYEACNLDMSRSLMDLAEDAINCEVKAYITETPSKQEGDDRVFNNIRSFAPLD